MRTGRQQQPPRAPACHLPGACMEAASSDDIITFAGHCVLLRSRQNIATVAVQEQRWQGTRVYRKERRPCPASNHTALAVFPCVLVCDGSGVRPCASCANSGQALCELRVAPLARATETEAEEASTCVWPGSSNVQPMTSLGNKPVWPV